MATTLNFAYPQLLEILQELIDKRETGTLFIRSENNRLATFTLQDGQAIAISFGPKRGDRAIPCIKEISSGTYRFDKESPVGTPQRLPDTGELMTLLKSNGESTEIVDMAGTGSASGGATNKNSHRFSKELKELLTDHLGPIAEVIYDDTLETLGGVCSNTHQAQILIDRLSTDIDDAEIWQFREKAGNIIGRTLNGGSF